MFLRKIYDDDFHNIELKFTRLMRRMMQLQYCLHDAESCEYYFSLLTTDIAVAVVGTVKVTKHIYLFRSFFHVSSVDNVVLQNLVACSRLS